MIAKLLFVGDVHLGRALTRIPPALAEETDPWELAPTAAWKRTVEYALAHRPDAVILAGDVVESENARFEAFRHLKDGVRRLGEAGITVCGVAGNHDVEALPRLARAIEGFHLLGADGGWSLHTVSRDETPLVHVAGRSFTGHGRSAGLPLERFPDSPDGRPVLGVVHCDLDATESRYAPVSRHALASTDAAGWFLGHVHRPSLPNTPRPIGYLGSLVGLDPTETGRRGPWWVEVTPGGDIASTHLPLAPLRWDRLEVSVAEDLAPEDLLNHLDQAVREDHDAHAGELGEARVLGYRLRLTGRVRRHDSLQRELEALAREPMIIPLGDRVAFLDRIVDDTAPALDLGEIGRGEDPAGLLARDLEALETQTDRAAELIALARQRLSEVANGNQFQRLEAWDNGDEAIRARLLRAGRRALVELLGQTEAEESRA
jgi:DNA repair exonuclease SbcCD nuclease subunit